jgi:hypothetical protein
MVDDEIGKKCHEFRKVQGYPEVFIYHVINEFFKHKELSGIEDPTS